MRIILIILCFVFFTGDDPPKNKKDTALIQRSINLEQLNKLNKKFDSLIQRQDTLIKRK